MEGSRLDRTRRCAAGLAAELVERLLGGGLLGSLLAASGAAADRLALEHRGHLEDTVVRRPSLADDVVAYAAAAAREKLLQSGLEVDPRVCRELDPGHEGSGNGGGRGLEPEGQETGPDQGFGHLRQGPGGPEQHVDRDRIAAWRRRRGAQAPRDVELAADLGNRDPADRLVEDLGEAADVPGGKAGEDLGGDGKAEDAVAEEREAAVGVDPLRGPGRRGQGLAGEVGR